MTRNADAVRRAPFLLRSSALWGLRARASLRTLRSPGAAKKLDHRSQSGRMVCVAHQSFKETRRGHVIPLNLHSSTRPPKKVRRSTFQEEAVSLQLAADEMYHVRAVVHSLYACHLLDERDWKITARDQFKALYLADCESLVAYINHHGNSQSPTSAWRLG